MRPAMGATFSPGTLVLARYGLARPHTGSLRRGRRVKRFGHRTRERKEATSLPSSSSSILPTGPA